MIAHRHTRIFPDFPSISNPKSQQSGPIEGFFPIFQGFEIQNLSHPHYRRFFSDFSTI
jgi:hypothetical protein